MKKALFIVFLFQFYVLNAQMEALSSYALSMGFIGQSDNTSMLAFYNQAKLGELSGINASIYGQEFFGLTGYSLKAMSVSYSVLENGTLGLDLMTLGIPTYKEEKIGLAYGMLLFTDFYAGLQLNLHIIDQPNYYGDIYTPTAEISLYYKLNDNIALYSHIFNFANFIAKASTLPVMFSIAGSYKFSQLVNFTVEIEKPLSQPISYKWGSEFRFKDYLILRLGGKYQSSMYVYTMGVAGEYGRFRMGLSFANHPLVGMSGGFGISYGI